MMATNRVRIDLNSNNNNIVGLVLCVLSEICTAELAKDLHLDVLKVTLNKLSAVATAQLISGRKPFSLRSRLSKEFLSILVSSWTKYLHALRKKVMEFCSDAWPSWKMWFKLMKILLKD